MRAITWGLTEKSWRSRNLYLALFYSFALTTAGCKGLTKEDRVAYLQAQQQHLSTPTLEIVCPPSGCVFDKVVYRDPNKGGIQMPQEKTAADVLVHGMDTLAKIIGIGAPVAGFVTMGRYIKEANNVTTTTITNTHEDNDTTTLTDNSDHSVTTHEDNDNIAITDNSDHSSTSTTTTNNTTTTTDNSDNSNNSTNNSYNDNSVQQQSP